MKLITYTDGGARGNPGPAGIGAVVCDAQKHVLEEISRFIGATTNNQAEYRALLAALEACQRRGATEVACFLDSELVVKQMKREYRVKDAGLRVLYAQIHLLTQQIGKVTFTHIYREKNAHADRLVNEAIDNALINSV